LSVNLLQGAGFACVDAFIAEQAFTGFEINKRKIAAALVDDVRRASVDTVTAGFTTFYECILGEGPRGPDWIISS